MPSPTGDGRASCALQSSLIEATVIETVACVESTVPSFTVGAACDLATRYTERQLMLLYHAELRRRAHAKANLAEAVAFGYGGCKSDEGVKALDRYLDSLRQD